MTIKDNYIHNNWGPAAWADTDNANTTYTGNTITDNDAGAIIEEISDNFSITNNYIANNGWAGGLSDHNFPSPAIYISESGSDKTFGGVPGCPDTSGSDQPSYSSESVISGNTMVDNGGGVFLWQDSNRFCGDGFDKVCTLVRSGSWGRSRFPRANPTFRPRPSTRPAMSVTRPVRRSRIGGTAVSGGPRT